MVMAMVSLSCLLYYQELIVTIKDFAFPLATIPKIRQKHNCEKKKYIHVLLNIPIVPGLRILC